MASESLCVVFFWHSLIAVIQVYQKVPNKPRTKVCLSTELSWILLRRVIIDKITQVLDIPRSLSW